jgi:hypothetical protein
MLIAGICFVVGALLVPETKEVDIASGESTAGSTPQIAPAAK